MDCQKLSTYIMVPISTSAIMLGVVVITLINYNINKIFQLDAIWYEMQIITIFFIIALILTTHTYITSIIQNGGGHINDQVKQR